MNARLRNFLTKSPGFLTRAYTGEFKEDFRNVPKNIDKGALYP